MATRLCPLHRWRHVLLERRDAHGARGLQDAAGVLEDVLDRRADFVGVDDDEVVHQRLDHPEGFLTHQLDGRSVGEQANIVQLHPPLPALTDRSMASESTVWTPITLISGRKALI